MSGNDLKYGTYNLIYKATDRSNNMSMCSFTIQINQFVPQGGLACYGDVNLTASFNDIQIGNTLVRSWTVATICGDMTMCTQRITVNPSGATCTTLRPMIAGAIRRLTGDNVSATVVLSSNSDSLDSRTDAIFAFNSLIFNRNYTITPRRENIDWTKGVTTFDVALVSRHVLGITPFASPYTIISADVDRDGDVSGVDMLLMQQLILRRRSELPNNNSWRFVAKSPKSVQ